MNVRSLFCWRQVARATGIALLAVLVFPAYGGVGVTQLPGTATEGPVTLFYPTTDPTRVIKRGPFALDIAPDGALMPGNGRLVVISHGSGGAPWVHADLARALVGDGFVVAMPEHRGDNYRDASDAGPDSWKRRPQEVSHAIDAVQRDARFASLLDLGKVGLYGMSAGGHTALTLAGGRWSPSGFKRHCDAHLDEDFHACVGLATRLRGNVFDGIKKIFARWIIDGRFSDADWYIHDDPRIAAVVAGVPYAADFDMVSLSRPRVPLALVTAGQDKWLVPRFHSERVLAACAKCEVLAHLENAGHGALLSPFPSDVTGLVAELLQDGPGFARSALPEVDRRISEFFQRNLAPMRAWR